MTKSGNGKPVIPRKRNSKTGNADIDLGLDRNRHLVENAIARLKHFRASATRYDKLKRNYVGACRPSLAHSSGYLYESATALSKPAWRSKKSKSMILLIR